MARPLKEVDEKLVESLASVGCTNKEIATLAGCSDDTLTRRFADTLEMGRATLRMSLRREQVKRAQAGNVGMLVWLGKNLLGQSDKTEVKAGKLADLYADPLEQRNGHGGKRSVAAGLAGNGNGRSARIPPPTAD